ncbi:hypothetical protein [Candidatus Nitrososphaera sp. FF02]|uniref:hypothetical protein n=1 Tax=Candidatus Nitrososphaera sp. FF02 TaxID=3398226 RepID=UPI0039EAC286
MVKTSRTRKAAGRGKGSRTRVKAKPHAKKRRAPKPTLDQKLSKVKLRRSSGRTEPYDMERMAKTISRSGTPFVMARDITKTVSKKIAEDIPKSRRVHAGRVRRMVAEEMASRNRPDIAQSYRGERPENTRQERHGFERENQPVHDNTANSMSRLVDDKSSRSARSTKFKT